MDYYSVIKKNGILPFVPTWIDLKGIMLSEMDRTGKDKSQTGAAFSQIK